MIKTILFILFFIVIGVSIFVLVAVNSNTKSKKGMVDLTSSAKQKKKINKIAGVALVASSLLALLIPNSFHQVEAGEVAVVKTLGKVNGIRMPGTYFDFYLFNDYIYFDTTIQKLEIRTSSYSSDAQTMDIEMTVQYKIDPTKAENILTEYISLDSLSQRIEKVADDNAKSILSKYTAMKIIETRASISPEVQEAVKLAIDEKYYATVTAVNLTNIDFTDEFEKSVEDKVIAEQQKEAAITKAEQELEVAKLTAQAKIVEAEGNAESQKIIARASAEAMALKIVELAKSTGFNVNETYLKKVETTVINKESQKQISSKTTEEETNVKPEESVNFVEDETTLTTITTTIAQTNYSIVYDETHTKEDLKIVLEFVKYLEYLEKWNGELPTVVAGDKGVDIIIPSNPSGN
ncbi:MAG: prohibitin family protein [Bacilli bacterium]